MWWFLACSSPPDTGEATGDTGVAATWETVAARPCPALEPGFHETTPWEADPDRVTGDETGLGVAIADMNADGLLDVILTNQDAGEIWYQLDDSWVSRTIYTGRSINVLVPIDLDGDGDLDLDAGGNDVGGWLENQGGGHFTSHLSADHMITSLAWADVDGDGALDRIVGAFGYPNDSWFDNGGWQPGHPNRVELATGEALALPAELAQGYTYVLAPLDADDDGDVDLYAVNDFGNQVLGNQLARGPEMQVEPSYIGNGMGLAIGDVNHDGHPDLAFSGWQNNALLLSDGEGGYIDASASSGLMAALADRHVGWGADFGDVDNDGDLDLLLGFGHLAQEFATREGQNPEAQRDALLLNQEGVFVDATEAWGLTDTRQTRGVVLHDLNGDGFVDVVRNNLAARGQVLLNGCNDNAWLVVEPRQDGADHPGAVGAKVQVVGPERTWTEWIQAGGRSLSSAGPQTAHFGLGLLDEVTVRVTWPDGAVSEQTLPTRQRVIVTR